MKNRAVNDKKEDILKEWCFRELTPTETEMKVLASHVAEIGTRTIFKNFSYRFGEKIYRQSSGGPIGARVTMCAARLVMQDFGEKYKASLTLARMELTLLSGYVDDVRQAGTSLRLGMKYSIENEK